MKYGRQRWKLRGRMELNARQVWDSEEIVFLPLISDFLSVKVCHIQFYFCFFSLVGERVQTHVRFMLDTIDRRSAVIYRVIKCECVFVES